MTCLSPDDGDHAILKHSPDHPFRSWHSGNPFRAEAASPYKRPPAQPVVARIETGDEGAMAEFWDNPVPLMRRGLYERLLAAGIDNLEVYGAEIREEGTGKIHSDYVAFNLIGKVAVADLKSSKYTGLEPPKVDGAFTSVKVHAGKLEQLLLFRLTEAVNAIVVHERVKLALEAAGIDTLTFMPLDQWGT